MKNKISILILLIVSVLPQMVSAAWWNPLSWFREDKTQINSLVEVEKKDLASTTAKSDITTYPTLSEEPKVVERTVTKTVQVPIDRIVEKIVPDQSIINENNSLKKQIQALQASSSQCLLDLNKLQERIKEWEIPLSQAEVRKKEINTQIANIDLEIAKTRNGYYDKAICAQYGCDNSGPDRDIKIGDFEIQKAQLQVEFSKL